MGNTYTLRAAILAALALPVAAHRAIHAAALGDNQPVSVVMLA